MVVLLVFCVVSIGLGPPKSPFFKRGFRGYVNTKNGMHRIPEFKSRIQLTEKGMASKMSSLSSYI